MGQFTNTIYSNTIENVIKGYQNRVNQATSYFKFINQKPTPVTYFNINTTRSSLDHGTDQQYDQLTSEDPLRYNRINGFYLYGIGRVETMTNIGEFGPESNIEGEATVLPNTIIPLEGDYFTIDYLINGDKKILFRVISSNRDTLDNGANFYRIQYKMDQTMEEFYDQLLNQVVKTFKYIPSNIGTNMASLLDEESLASIDNLLSIRNMLRQYYINLFYKSNIQTFIYPYNDAGMLIYDPYLIEFLIRNKVLLSYDDDYMYLSQATFKSTTFAVEYAKTIFMDVENRNPQMSLNTAYPIEICDMNSLLVDRMEEYLELSIQRKNFDFHSPINILDLDLLDRIVNNSTYDESDKSKPLYRNLIINFMNGKNETSITSAQLESIDNINYARTMNLFYEIPLMIHVINTYVTNMMTDKTKSTDDTCTLCGKECYVNGK